MKNIRNIILASKLNNPNIVFYALLLTFLIDSSVNFFSKIPVFVPVSILFLPFLWFISSEKKRFLPFAIISAVFILTAIANNLIYGFHQKNVSDLLFILLFIASYFYYQNNIKLLKKSTIYVFLTVSFVMFVFTFFNLNSDNWQENQPLYEKTIQVEEQEYQSGTSEFFDERKPLDFLEIFRNYHNGLFRLPHIAAYFFGFIFLFFAFQFQKTKQRAFLYLSGVLLILLFYTGVRSVIVGLGLSVFLFLLTKLRWGIMASVFLLFVGVIFMRNFLYETFQNTFLGQYFGMIITLFDNFSGFSRFLLWKSWYYEIKNFDGIDFLTGKGFISSMQANTRNIYFKEWFHSDPLSIVYVYGIPGLTAFFYLFYRIYSDNAKAIRENLFIFSFFFTMIFLSLINGFYYFFPVFLLFIFLAMIFIETNTNDIGTSETISN